MATFRSWKRHGHYGHISATRTRSGFHVTQPSGARIPHHQKHPAPALGYPNESTKANLHLARGPALHNLTIRPPRPPTAANSAACTYSRPFRAIDVIRSRRLPRNSTASSGVANLRHCAPGSRRTPQQKPEYPALPSSTLPAASNRIQNTIRLRRQNRRAPREHPHSPVLPHSSPTPRRPQSHHPTARHHVQRVPGRKLQLAPNFLRQHHPPCFIYRDRGFHDYHFTIANNITRAAKLPPSAAATPQQQPDQPTPRNGARRQSRLALAWNHSSLPTSPTHPSLRQLPHPCQLVLNLQTDKLAPAPAPRATPAKVPPPAAIPAISVPHSPTPPSAQPPTHGPPFAMTTSFPASIARSPQRRPASPLPHSAHTPISNPLQ